MHAFVFFCNPIHDWPLDFSKLAAGLFSVFYLALCAGLLCCLSITQVTLSC